MAKSYVDLAKPFAPVDEFTGIPLPILPVMPPFGALRSRQQLEESCRADNHHAYFPKEDFTTNAQRVLRHARIQYGGRWAHARYHEMYRGVVVPTDVHRQFRLAVLTAAGFIPEMAVDVREGRPEQVGLTAAERRKMQERTIRTEARISHTTGLDINRSHRGMFFMSYALQQDFNEIGVESLLDEFVYTTDERRRLRLGYRIFDLAFQRAGDNIEDLYSVAKREGHIHPTQPESPLKLVRTVVHGHQQRYLGVLSERILQDVAA